MSPNLQTGILDLSNKGQYGRLRLLKPTLSTDSDDPVVGIDLINRHQLRPGLHLEVELGGPVNGQRPGPPHRRKGKGKKKKKSHKKNSKQAIGPRARRVLSVRKIEGVDAVTYQCQRKFEDLTIIDPKPRLTLEYPDCPPACRLIDLFCPVGYGQRGMIVSPPKAGKTILLQNIALAAHKSHPEMEVIALLIDERPEEVTDFHRNLPCTVWASSNDHTPQQHVQLAMVAVDRAKRMAEQGKDVMILLDSLTRLGRAFNNAPGMASTGRTMSGGLDSGALAIPKQLFGAARKFEEGGSLTIVATALVDTGSRADQIIFEEFKGTGNMELILDRKIAEHRVFPAINLAASGTRKEHLLLNEAELSTMTALRRRLLNMQPVMQIEQLLKALERFKTNGDLVGNPQSSTSPQAAARR